MVIKINGSEVFIIAHRGGRFWAGNGKNFNYISESLYHGADVVELDIKLKEGVYIVQHSKASVNQGLLEDALKKIGHAALYLDIKDSNIDPNDLIKFVRGKTENTLIIGSFFPEILKKIKKSEKILISYQMYSPLYDIKSAKKLNADWVVLWNYNIAKWKIKDLKQNGLMVALPGNLLLKKQLNYLKNGANIVFVYDVKKFKKNLSKQILFQKQEKNFRIIYDPLRKAVHLMRRFFPEGRTIAPSMKINSNTIDSPNFSAIKINFKLR